VLHDDVALGSDLNVIRTEHNGVFLSYYLNGPKRWDIAKVAQGDAVVHLYPSQLEKLGVALPNQLEQQKIAECLSSVDELITAQAQKLDALKTHKKGLMQQLFPREGETEPRLRFPEFRNAGVWAVQRLDELAGYENGKAHENDISEKGRFVVVNSKFISTEGSVRKYSNEGFCVAAMGEVLMVLSDVPNGKAIAKCYYVETDDRYTVNQRICRIQPTKVSGKFLFYILDRNSYFLDFDDGVKQTNLRKEDVIGFAISAPPQTCEQQRIADCLTSLDDLIAAQTQKLGALKIHKKGLMQQLFPSPEELKA
jgi:type I restriction enzyme, S subunit